MKLLAALLSMAMAASAARVAIVAQDGLDSPAQYGLAKLTESLKARGFAVDSQAPAGADFVVLAGTSSDGRMAGLFAQDGLPRGAQSLAVRRVKWQGIPGVALCGGDARGVMYAALEVAGDAGRAVGADPFAGVRETSESPFLAERGISMYTMQRAYFESRLFDENYWRRYFDLLARSRINAFTIIFGYENGGFMAPLYPYFFNVPAFPGVRFVGITEADQKRHTAALRSLIRIAHERGVDVIPAIWDHIYRGGVQGGGIAGASDTVGKETPHLVAGVTAENLNAYTKAALNRFLEVFPEIDGLEFRMHGESGLKREEMAGFWHEIFAGIAKAKPGLRLTLRAKELPDSIIEDALAQGLNARVETKYWMEQMGMPFHPTHVNTQNQHDRRHGYADLLRYPQRYRVHWRLWSGGTTRMLLWSDPDYVRRFAHSAKLYGGNSIDVNEMLATKMLGEAHDRAPMPILNAAHRYYDYEFERYWHFYQVWGRVAYDPGVGAEAWAAEFGGRFGSAGPALMRGLHTASKVLPRIVAASYRYQLFPTTRGWAEMMRQGDLKEFASAEGSDIEQFQNPRDAAKDIVSGDFTSKRTPEDTSRWFSRTADAILAEVAAAERVGAKGNEAASTLTDLRILAWLARYHAARLKAAVAYNLFKLENDAAVLDTAIEHERSATAAWAAMVKAAGDVYASDLAFGVHRVGFPRHWREELAKLEAGLKALEAERGTAARASGAAPRKERQARGEPGGVRLIPPGRPQAGRDLEVAVMAEDPGAIRSLRLRYRHMTQFEDYQTAEMTREGETGRFTARIPAAFIQPKWDLVYFVERIDQSGNGRNYPDLEVEAPYGVVTAP